MGAVILQHVHLKKGLSNREFNIAVKNGDYFAFIGGEKSDASKIIRAIAGREKISRGTVAINDNVITGSRKLADALIAYIPNDKYYGLKAGRTVKDSIMIPMIKKKYKMSDCKNRYTECVRAFDLTQLENIKISKLTRLECLTVALAAAAVLFPSAYVLEAPLDGFDDPTAAIKTFKTVYSKLDQTLIFSAEKRETASFITSKILETI